ncbi:Type I restriction-modification system, specificity subunit S [Bacteroides ovatus]|uniref:restriction endonuclease subunit S n=1 Tax=Bacteroides ovatus TaxID=28116 RepID=UPI0020A6EF02|nr:restriction endonuclease subunit S [Bacteroides ovatus]CAG9901450.1 Type I restriction-modification system, specificity subunit S [Bacteroides ovatus]
MEEWKKYKLGEITSKIGSGATPKGGRDSYLGGNIALIRSQNVLDFSFSKLGLAYINEVQAEKLSNVEVYEKDVLLNITGDSVARVCIVPNNVLPARVNQHVVIIRGNDKVDYRYLLYYLQYIKPQLLSLSQGGATRNALTKKMIEELEVKMPSKGIQKEIVSILYALDSKIELNRRINDNLEQQTQALFKSWFVDNPKPNWSETTFSEVANFIGGYSYKGEELTDSSNIAMVTIKNFGRNGGFKADGFKGIAPFVKLKECHYANLFDILVAHTDLTQNADVIGNAELLLTYGRYDGIIFSMDLVKVLPKNNFPYRFLLAAMLKNKIFKGHCLGYVNGTTVLHLSKKALPNFEVKIPPKAEAKTMNDALAPYYQRMAEVLQENDRLIHLRDTLLPKLMSGELNINAKSRLQ